jgi:hypothetical protein
MLNLQAKTTMYDFYQTLEKLTSNDGQKPPNRYQVFIRIMREYRHLKMLKRGGRGHDPDGAAATKPGELAVLCPTCPRPGVNLPDDWEKASKEQRCVTIQNFWENWISYSIQIHLRFVSGDRCVFPDETRSRLQRTQGSRAGDSMSYMVEDGPYRNYLLTVTEQKEVRGFAECERALELTENR